MEDVITSLPNGTFFKVVTSKPASVLLLGGEGLEAKTTQYSFTSFLRSVDSGYVGKEFIYLSVHNVKTTEEVARKPRIQRASDLSLTESMLERRMSSSRVFQPKGLFAH